MGHDDSSSWGRLEAPLGRSSSRRSLSMSRAFWLRAGLLVSVQLTSLCAFSDQPLFYIRDLGPGVARGLNDFGQVVGVFQGDGAVWSETMGFTSLPPYQPSPSSTSAPIAINNAGQVTGRSGFQPSVDVFWDSPQAAPIAINLTPGGGAAAINSQGSVVGTSGNPSSHFPWIWRNGTFERLPVLPAFARAESHWLSERHQRRRSGGWFLARSCGSMARRSH